MACILATLGEVDKAIEYLGKAVKFGTVSAAWMRNDDDLENLRGDPRFEKLLLELESDHS